MSSVWLLEKRAGVEVKTSRGEGRWVSGAEKNNNLMVWCEDQVESHVTCCVSVYSQCLMAAHVAISISHCRVSFYLILHYTESCLPALLRIPVPVKWATRLQMLHTDWTEAFFSFKISDCLKVHQWVQY